MKFDSVSYVINMHEYTFISLSLYIGYEHNNI